MNFYEMEQILDNKTKPGIKTKNQTVENNPPVEKGDYISLMSKVSRKLGEKSNKYTPLIRFVSRNPAMLSLLEQLIEETSLAQQSKMTSVFK